MPITKAATSDRSVGAIGVDADPANAAAVPEVSGLAISGLAGNAAVPGAKAIADVPARKDPGSAAKNLDHRVNRRLCRN